MILQRKVSPTFPEFMFLNLKGVQAISTNNFPLYSTISSSMPSRMCILGYICPEQRCRVINKHFYVVAFLYIQLSTKYFGRTIRPSESNFLTYRFAFMINPPISLIKCQLFPTFHLDIFRLYQIPHRSIFVNIYFFSHDIIFLSSRPVFSRR